MQIRYGEFLGDFSLQAHFPKPHYFCFTLSQDGCKILELLIHLFIQMCPEHLSMPVTVLGNENTAVSNKAKGAALMKLTF